ncbi:MAG: amine dehydrogenase large subunit [Gammaproteobacteria bacterium]|nr:amine dehydrogenase large subunit [Gammaproteobacteria bacterium]
MTKLTVFLLASCFAFWGARAWSELVPDEMGATTAGKPEPHWFMVLGSTGAYVFDGDNGAMQGSINKPAYAPAITVDIDREMFYVPGSYYSRGIYGERTDVVVFNAMDTLAPVAEVRIPAKMAAIGHRGMSNLVGEQFLVIFNLTPAMSVSVVDVEAREFVVEISTAGCGMVFPVPERRFLQLCGEGTLQVIGLDGRGNEASRVRSEKFFDIDEDPVFDYAVPTTDGWLLVSFEGNIYEVTFTDGIQISEPWSLLTEDDIEERWRIGGNQPFSYNAATGTLLTLMHQGGVDTHEEEGTEIWGFNLNTQRRGYRTVLEAPASAINVSRDADPRLFVVSSTPNTVLVYNALTGRLLNTVEEAGIFAGAVQRF